jgi:hypothetical protein
MAHTEDEDDGTLTTQQKASATQRLNPVLMSAPKTICSRRSGPTLTINSHAKVLVTPMPTAPKHTFHFERCDEERSQQM